jgi:threonine aldolase
MRQAGIIAAGGLYALQNNRERLADDHALAKDLASRLDQMEGLSCDPAVIQTNLVIVRVAGGAPALAEQLAQRGVKVMALSPDSLRFVTHMGVGPADVDVLVRSLQEILGG